MQKILFSTSSLALFLLTSSASAQRVRDRNVPHHADRACIPGAQHACDCPGGDRSVQICAPDGLHLLACACPNADSNSSINIAVSERHNDDADPSETHSTDNDTRHPFSAPWAQRSESMSSRWYGWQILICNLAGNGLGAIAVATGNLGPLVGGATINVLGGPIVHWAHGSVGRGFGSLGLRVALPLLGLLVGMPGNEHRDYTGSVVGASIGSLAAIVLDIAWLAREPVYTRISQTPRVLPSIAFMPGATPAIGLTGSF